MGHLMQAIAIVCEMCESGLNLVSEIVSLRRCFLWEKEICHHYLINCLPAAHMEIGTAVAGSR